MKYQSLLFIAISLMLFLQCSSEKLMPDQLVARGEEINLTYEVITSDGLVAKQQVKSQLIKTLKKALAVANKQLIKPEKIKTVSISATTNGVHSKGSYHYLGLAIDICKINGQRIIHLKKNNQIFFLQEALDKMNHVKENFGPCLKTKTTQEGFKKKVSINNHEDHIHFSIHQN